MTLTDALVARSLLPRGPKGPKGPKGEKGAPGKDGVGPDKRVAVSAADPKPGFLGDKLAAGRNISLTPRSTSDGDVLVIDAQPSFVPMGRGGGGGGGGGGSPHPGLAGHDALGLATDAELVAHAATPHGGTHPDLAAHDTLGLATDAEMTAAIAAAIVAHAATPHGSDVPAEIGMAL